MSVDTKPPFPLQDTFNEEFFLQVNKLRRLIGHRPSLGRYIELLLINVLRKYFPRKYKISSGFYVSQNSSDKGLASQQLDIIIYDNENFPIMFDCADFVVVTPKSIKSAIEVKSTLTLNSIIQVIQQSNSKIATQLPLYTKFNLLSVKSSISAKQAFDKIKDIYNNIDGIPRALGLIYSLDWNEIIVFSTNQKSYNMLLLNNFNYGLSTFFNMLLHDVYGTDAYISIANSIGSSLFIPIETYTIRTK